MTGKLLRKQSKLDLTISERRHSYQSNRYNHQKKIYSWKGKLVLVLEREKIALQRKLKYEGLKLKLMNKEMKTITGQFCRKFSSI